MSDIDTFHDLLAADDVAKDLVVDANLNAVNSLFRDLRGALDHCGRSMSDVARIVGIPEVQARAVLGGRVDLTLSELGQVAYALDAAISFRVVHTFSHHASSILNRVGPIEDSLWTETGEQFRTTDLMRG